MKRGALMPQNIIGRRFASVLLTLSGLFFGPVAAAHAALNVFNSGVSADGLGNVYITGTTEGSLGAPNAGFYDAFVAKYDATRVLLWIRQLGTAQFDASSDVSADGLGNVYISGYTVGSLGGPNAGSMDAFVAKYDAGGNLQWTRQLGTTDYDDSLSISADALGNVYISGQTEGSLGGPNAGSNDAFVAKFDSGGNLQWTRQLGTTQGDQRSKVSADGLGNVYISGETGGSLGGPNAGSGDAFVAKYDVDGTLQWTKQLGTAALDYSSGVSADGLGNVYISGETNGSLGGPNAGSSDAFVAKYDVDGTLQWTKQLGTAASDYSSGVSVDGLGNLYISGDTHGSLDGPNAGSADAFVAKYDAGGNLQWTRQLGTARGDLSDGVSADGLGSLYISGDTFGSLGGPNEGSSYDAFVAKYDTAGHLQWTRQLGFVPEPASWLLAALAGAVCVRASRLRLGRTEVG